MSEPAGRVVLKPQKARPLFGRHPWVFSGAIARVIGEPAPGDEVAVFSYEGEFIAWGLFNPHSQIHVRLYSWDYDRKLTTDFWREQLDQAVALRRDVLGLLSPTTACRLVFSEADGLSGLIADWYAGWLAVQVTSLGIYKRLEMLAPVLMELTGARGVYVRTEKGMKEAEGIELQDGPLLGEEPPETVQIEENGLKFAVNIRVGHKTGWYLDQRENRRAVARYAAGRRVLDLFSYAGGFGLLCARFGAAEVVAVDSSEAALTLAEQNAALNQITNFRTRKEDIVRWLAEEPGEGDLWDMIILDPPRLARKKKGINGAVRGYLHLNRAALRRLRPGGILVTCSCSGLVTRELFLEVIRQAAFDAGKGLQILEHRGAAPDHPVSVYCPENDYLKCLICRVQPL